MQISAEGSEDGIADTVGTSLGKLDGEDEGLSLGKTEGEDEGLSLGADDGADDTVGSLLG